MLKMSACIGNLTGMRKWRRKYYDIFSSFYDWVIKAHSKDARERLREFLIEKAELTSGMRVLDLCTGTGSVAVKVKELYPDLSVFGLDFSMGMLRKAKSKRGDVFWVLGSAAGMPFKDEVFDVVFCSHAFYELKGKEKYWALGEVKRVLKKGGRFLLMEHEVPKNGFIRFLYYIRILSMGFGDGLDFVKRELDVLRLFFPYVTRLSSPTGKSKLIIGEKR